MLTHHLGEGGRNIPQLAGLNLAEGNSPYESQGAYQQALMQLSYYKNE